MLKIILILSLISLAYSASLYEDKSLLLEKISADVKQSNLSNLGTQLSASVQTAVAAIVQPLMSSLIGSALQPIRQIQDSIDPNLKPVIKTSLQAIFNTILGN